MWIQIAFKPLCIQIYVIVKFIQITNGISKALSLLSLKTRKSDFAYPLILMLLSFRMIFLGPGFIKMETNLQREII